MTPDPLQRFSDGVVRLRPLDVADAEAQVVGEDDEMPGQTAAMPSASVSRRSCSGPPSS